MTKIFKTLFDSYLRARLFVKIVFIAVIILIFFYDSMPWLLYKVSNLFTIRSILGWLMILILIDYHYQGV